MSGRNSSRTRPGRGNARGGNSSRARPGRGTIRQRGPEAEDYEDYEVEEILMHILNDNEEPEFMIRWKGWGAEHDSWLTAEDLQNSGDLLTSYMTQQTISFAKINRKQCEVYETKLVASINQVVQAPPSSASSSSISSSAASSVIINPPVQSSVELSLQQLVADWRDNVDEAQVNPASSTRSLSVSSRRSYGDHRRSPAGQLNRSFCRRCKTRGHRESDCPSPKFTTANFPILPATLILN
ncbi:uncharacterized protein LOC118433713 [Folsomia candida]|uniref:uncharacterized protein LOC118433713 n=1 Tax=Folsomia candida TaxID=158441 RepID=UPI001605256B|nr:uncharacterized protein LOC118433713 [Folsomia candida]